MARVQLIISDVPNRLTLRSILEREGHVMVDDSPDAVIGDPHPNVLEHVADVPTLVLANAGQMRDAVDALGKGAFGYIIVPFQPGEAALMVQRALHATEKPKSVEENTADIERSLEDVEREHILNVLRHCRNNQAKAARVLGIGRNTLWRKLKKYNVDTNES